SPRPVTTNNLYVRARYLLRTVVYCVQTRYRVRSCDSRARPKNGSSSRQFGWTDFRSRRIYRFVIVGDPTTRDALISKPFLSLARYNNNNNNNNDDDDDDDLRFVVRFISYKPYDYDGIKRRYRYLISLPSSDNNDNDNNNINNNNKRNLSFGGRYPLDRTRIRVAESVSTCAERCFSGRDPIRIPCENERLAVRRSAPSERFAAAVVSSSDESPPFVRGIVWCQRFEILERIPFDCDYPAAVQPDVSDRTVFMTIRFYASEQRKLVSNLYNQQIVNFFFFEIR
ncbi:hypothetical protein AGLY_002328, partial [Aphis glycines]